MGTRQHILQHQPRETQPHQTGCDVSARSPYLDARGALAYLQLRSLSCLYYHIKENRLPTLRRGGRYLFDVRELDAWLRGTNSVELRRKVR